MYANEECIEVADIFSNRNIRVNILKKYSANVINDAKLKDDFKEVSERVLSRCSHYIITAREDSFVPDNVKTDSVTQK